VEEADQLAVDGDQPFDDADQLMVASGNQPVDETEQLVADGDQPADDADQHVPDDGPTVGGDTETESVAPFIFSDFIQATGRAGADSPNLSIASDNSADIPGDKDVVTDSLNTAGTAPTSRVPTGMLCDGTKNAGADDATQNGEDGQEPKQKDETEEERERNTEEEIQEREEREKLQVKKERARGENYCTAAIEILAELLLSREYIAL
jgi:hypothetical protein